MADSEITSVSPFGSYFSVVIGPEAKLAARGRAESFYKLKTA